MAGRGHKLPENALGGTLRIIGELHDIIDEMCKGKTPRQAARWLVTEHGKSRTQANRYVAAAIAMLQRDAQDEPLESKRARLEARANKVYQMALERKRGWVDRQGNQVEIDEPDLRVAGQMIELQAKLDRVLGPNTPNPAPNYQQPPATLDKGQDKAV